MFPPSGLAWPHGHQGCGALPPKYTPFSDSHAAPEVCSGGSLSEASDVWDADLFAVLFGFSWPNTLRDTMSSEGLTVSVTGADEYPVVDSFDDLDLREGLLRGIYSYGFEKPGAIQQRAIRPVLDGRDPIGQAQSGTGKSATFVIGSLQWIDFGHKACQAFILAPTRELAQQIHKVVAW